TGSPSARLPPFRIASVTKNFTAAAILRLAENSNSHPTSVANPYARPTIALLDRSGSRRRRDPPCYPRTHGGQLRSLREVIPAFEEVRTGSVGSVRSSV